MNEDGSNSSRNPDGTFKKGFTANRKGAPPKVKRKQPSTAFDILMDERFDPVASDLPSDLAPEHEAAFRTLQAALNGKKRATRQVLEHIRRRDEERIQSFNTIQQRRPVERLLEPHDPSNIDEALLILGIASSVEGSQPTEQRPRLKLLSWAVQAAIGRRHGGHGLTSGEIKAIEFSTTDASKLRWPRGYSERDKKP